MNKYWKIFIGVVAVYLIVGCVVAFNVNPVSRGGIISTVEFILFWPIIFIWPLN